LEGTPALTERRANALTLGEFLDTHYQPWADEHLTSAGETLARLRVNFAAWLDSRLVDLSPFSVEKWRTTRLKANKAKGTINRDMTALKAALSKAVSWGHLKTHPLAAVKPYKLDSRGVVRYLTADEEARLLKALDTRD
jgi:integrase